MKESGPTSAIPPSLTRKQRIALPALSTAIAWSVKGLAACNRLEVQGREHEDAAKAQQKGWLIGFWHEVLGIAAWYYRSTGYYTLTSHSFDGELAARVAEHFGLVALRGSSSRGGIQALVELRKVLATGKTVGLTLDGPRGPRRVAKPGIAILSAQTRLPILPNAFAATRGRRLNSWDKTLIPKPFGRIICAYGPLIPPPKDISSASIEATRTEVENSLKRLHERLETEITNS